VTCFLVGDDGVVGSFVLTTFSHGRRL
jgi:hypothetical protein